MEERHVSVLLAALFHFTHLLFFESIEMPRITFLLAPIGLSPPHSHSS